MATIKSYTDFSQSKTLRKILPLESADMCYVIDYAESNKYGTDHFKLEVDTYGLKVKTRDNVPCWSLASLLNVIPGCQVNRMANSDKWEASSWNDSDFEPAYYVEGYDNAIDACYEMILKLNELKML